MTCTVPYGYNITEYHWQKDSEAIPGALSEDLLFNPLVKEDGGWYRCQYQAGNDSSDFSNQFYVEGELLVSTVVSNSQV